MNPIFSLLIFIVFFFVEYCIFVASNYLLAFTTLTGWNYWCVFVVVFLIINEFCLGMLGYNEIDLSRTSRDEEEEYDWL